MKLELLKFAFFMVTTWDFGVSCAHDAAVYSLCKNIW